LNPSSGVKKRGFREEHCRKVSRSALVFCKITSVLKGTDLLIKGRGKKRNRGRIQERRTEAVQSLTKREEKREGDGRFFRIRKRRRKELLSGMAIPETSKISPKGSKAVRGHRKECLDRLSIRKREGTKKCASKPGVGARRGVGGKRT